MYYMCYHYTGQKKHLFDAMLAGRAIFFSFSMQIFVNQHLKRIEGCVCVSHDD